MLRGVVLQRGALTTAGCDRIFIDVVPGCGDRPPHTSAPGGTLIFNIFGSVTVSQIAAITSEDPQYTGCLKEKEE